MPQAIPNQSIMAARVNYNQPSERGRFIAGMPNVVYQDSIPQPCKCFFEFTDSDRDHKPKREDSCSAWMIDKSTVRKRSIL